MYTAKPNMIKHNATNPIQALLQQLQQQQVKQKIEQQYQMLEQGRVVEEEQRLMKNNPNISKQGTPQQDKLNHSTLAPSQQLNIPPPQPQQQQVISTPKGDFTIASSMEQYIKLEQDEIDLAKQQGRQADFSSIKKPGYKPPKTKAPIVEVKRYVNNPNYDPVYAGNLLNYKDYNEKMFKSKKKVFDNYNVYRQKWSQRHKFLAPNPQYQQVEYLLKTKEEQVEKSKQVENTDAYKRGQQMLQQEKKEFGGFGDEPTIKLGYNAGGGGGGYSTI